MDKVTFAARTKKIVGAIYIYIYFFFKKKKKKNSSGGSIFIKNYSFGN